MPTLTILPLAAVTLTWMLPRPPARAWSLPTTVCAPETLALPVVSAAELADFLETRIPDVVGQGYLEA